MPFNLLSKVLPKEVVTGFSKEEICVYLLANCVAGASDNPEDDTFGFDVVRAFSHKDEIYNNLKTVLPLSSKSKAVIDVFSVDEVRGLVIVQACMPQAAKLTDPVRLRRGPSGKGAPR